MGLKQAILAMALVGLLASRWFVPGTPRNNPGASQCVLERGGSCLVTPARYNFTTSPLTFRMVSSVTDVRFGIAVNFSSVKQKVYGKDLFALQSAGSAEYNLGVSTPAGSFPDFLYCGNKAGSADCTFGEYSTRTHSYIFETNTGGTFFLEWCAPNRSVGTWSPCLRKECLGNPRKKLAPEKGPT